MKTRYLYLLASLLCITQLYSSITITQKQLDSQLFMAIGRGSLSDVEDCLSNGAHLNARWESSMLPDGVENFCTPNATPLIIAARLNKHSIVKLLIANGAQLDLHDDYGLDAIAKAIWVQNVPMTKLLYWFAPNDPRFDTINKNVFTFMNHPQAERFSEQEKNEMRILAARRNCAL